MAKETEAQKRRRRLQTKRAQEHERGGIAYLGERYQTKRLVPLWMATESAIYEAFVMADRAFVDDTVEDALETLVKQIRRGPLPALPEQTARHYVVGEERELIVQTIRLKWRGFLATQVPRITTDELDGVVRSILGSIKKVRSPAAQSRLYLHHIEGFLKKQFGVSIRRVDERDVPAAVREMLTKAPPDESTPPNA